MDEKKEKDKKEFLSTLSVRRATAAVQLHFFHRVISIHALREESDGAALGVASGAGNFYPRSP